MRLFPPDILTRMVSIFHCLLLLLALLCCNGCLFKAPAAIEKPAVDPIQTWSSPHSRTEQNDDWLPENHRRTLTGLINEGLANNPALQQKHEEVEEAIQQALITGSDRLPQLEAFLRGGREDRGTSANRFSLGLDMGWELDIWGKLGDRTRAAALSATVAREGFRKARLDLTRHIAILWYRLVEENQQLELLLQRQKNLEQNLAIIEEGYQLGVNSSLDFYLARADYSATGARLENRRKLRLQVRRELEISLGRYPTGRIETDAGLLHDLPAIPAGIVADILNRRPDLLMAEHRLAAANLQLAEAYKNRFPSLKLTGQYGTASETLRDLTDPEAVLWSLLGGLAAPIFDGGRLKAKQRQNEARARQLAAAYQDTLFKAFIEVENGLDREEKLQVQQKHLKQASADSTRARDLAFEQYQHGLVGYVTVLEAERRAFDAQSTVLAIYNEQIQNRIDLILALGEDFDISSIGTSSKPNENQP
ncbi:MAG: TolC family protein [Thermodesulfobacteriota bacterium]